MASANWSHGGTIAPMPCDAKLPLNPSPIIGKTSGSALKVGSDIRNISGATLSCAHVTEGVKRIVAAYGSRVR